MFSSRIMTRHIVESGVDPDVVARLPDEGLDYRAMGFTHGTIVGKLAKAGLFKKSARVVCGGNGRERWVYGPGIHFEQWKEYYLNNREMLRAACNLPTITATM